MKHIKKLIAPLIITVLVGIYFLFFGSLFIMDGEIPMAMKVIGAIVPLCFLGVAIYVLIERIKEIRSGVEDDLSKY